MTGHIMRKYIDNIDTPVVLTEGLIDNIKQWISKLSEPVKKRGLEMISSLEKQLTARYGYKVVNQIKTSNKTWMWSKLTYKDLYDFCINSLGFSEDDLNKVLKNPIVNNNLKQVISASTADSDQKPVLPLTSSTIKNNNNYISSVIDKQTRQYLSKAIAVAVLEGLAYIEYSANISQPNQKSVPVNSNTSNNTSTNHVNNTSTEEPAYGKNTKPDADLKSAIEAIKAGLAKMKETN